MNLVVSNVYYIGSRINQHLGKSSSIGRKKVTVTVTHCLLRIYAEKFNHKMINNKFSINDCSRNTKDLPTLISSYFITES